MSCNITLIKCRLGPRQRDLCRDPVCPAAATGGHYL